MRLRAQAAVELTEDDLQGFAELAHRLSLQRLAAYAELVTVLDSDRYVDLLDELTDPPPFRAVRPAPFLLGDEVNILQL
jgi:hypothetical protein